MISDNFIDQVLNAVDLVQLIGKTVNLKKQGVRYIGLCPFHTEKSPSFQVNPQMGFFYCQGCKTGGNAITFLMKDQNLGFREAVYQLARENNIPVPEEKEPTPQERQAQLHKEALFIHNQKVAEFYRDQLKSNKEVSDYVFNRWGKTFAEEIGIGATPVEKNGLLKYAKAKGLNIDLLIELGLLSTDDKNSRVWDFYKNRAIIPIYDKSGRVIGFSARAMGDEKPKYLNSSNTLLYNKTESVFGINFAFREAIKQDKLYLVEGGPDVLRLELIKVPNTVASLGGEWTDSQLKQLKKMTSNLCFLPDADEKKNPDSLPVGVKSVIKNGTRALKAGFNVTVKEIPNAEGGKKNDPDSFCTTPQKLKLIEEEDFITWYATKLFDGKETTEDIHAAVQEIASLIILVDDEMKEEMYLSKVKDFYKEAGVWKKALKFARKRLDGKKEIEKNRKIDRDFLGKYGFCIHDGGYYSFNNNEIQWSNFTMEPMFHIRDMLNPKRMYRITNECKQEEIIELKQEDLVSLSKFRQRIEGIGNFIWEASEKELIKLKKFLYEQTETATEITQLGWQRNGFYAFGNGIYDGKWHPVDEYGIVRLEKEGNFYLPASSRIYANDDKLFQFERRFVHLNYNQVTLKDFSTKMIAVFGNNAKVGLCFLLATLFRDIIVNNTKNFPILNLFGPKGAGKSELGHSLMSFFIPKNSPPNISNATIAAMADAVAQCANAIVHLDEYKNTIDLDKREFLKGLWDGTGRSRMNMDRDKKREITSVDCGVVVSGQEMATADIALFSRFIFLAFNKVEFSKEEKRRFDELANIQGMGLTHLTLQILSHRSKMELGFVSQYKICSEDLQERLKKESIEDRILRNWLTPLAAFKVLENYLDLPFTYKDLLPIFVEGIVRQNKECKSNNELANFWNVVSFLQQEGEIFIDGDYKIKYLRGIKTNIANPEWINERPVLMLRKTRIFMLYKKYGKMVGDTILPEGSLRYYLENSKEFLGMKNSERFKDIRKGVETMKEVNTEVGVELKKASNVEQAMCFDYEMIKENYGIDINIYTD
jgi:DNA primase catalytic core|nr:MAG TPA: DNA primase, catalytic core [Caudoviricetes sp.]